MNARRLAVLHRLYFPLIRHFRRKRINRFITLFQVGHDTRILDVGGSDLIWSLLPAKPRVTLLNLEVLPPSHPAESGTWVVADGRCLPFRDGSFDIVFSNSVVEHLGDEESQQLFAREARRVGLSYYVQTPNRWFPIEPHYVTPFIHYLPKAWQGRLSRNFTLWGLVTRPSREECARQNRELRLLKCNELKALFPDAQVLPEKVLGITKSFVAAKVNRLA